MSRPDAIDYGMRSKGKRQPDVNVRAAPSLLKFVLQAKREHESAVEQLLVNKVLGLTRSGNSAARVPGVAQALVLGFNRAHSDADTEVGLLDLDGTVRDGTLPPSRVGAANIHLAILRELPQLNVVLHAHTVFTTAFALAQRPLPLRDAQLRAAAGVSELPVTAAVPGYAAEPVLQTLRAHPGARAVLLGNHGVWAWGESYEEVTALLVALEREAARAFDIDVLQRRVRDATSRCSSRLALH